MPYSARVRILKKIGKVPFLRSYPSVFVFKALHWPDRPGKGKQATSVSALGRFFLDLWGRRLGGPLRQKSLTENLRERRQSGLAETWWANIYGGGVVP